MMFVFVYGTLKRGHHNHGVLGDSFFMDTGHTEKYYVMFDAGFPVLLSPPLRSPTMRGKDEPDHPRLPVLGEIYDCSEAVLRRLDYLENNGVMYEREEIIITRHLNKTCLRAWTYIGVPEYWKACRGLPAFPAVNDKYVYPQIRSH
jgi:gamma-glutamylcyclotransferase (GGCT)/AIG2-like uncharacterized protein YtfP